MRQGREPGRKTIGKEKWFGGLYYPEHDESLKGKGGGGFTSMRKNVLTATIVITVILLMGMILPLTALSQPAYASAPTQAPGEVQTLVSTSPEYDLFLNETNLPQREVWSTVVASGSTIPSESGTPFKVISWINSSSRSHEVHGLKNGNYSYYSYANNPNFDFAGGFKIEGRSITINITLALTDLDNFTAVGLPSNVYALVALLYNNTSIGSSGPLSVNKSIGFYETNGRYTITAPSGYIIKSINVSTTTYSWSNLSPYPNVVTANETTNVNSMNYTLRVNSTNSTANITVFFQAVHARSPFPYWILLLIIGIVAIVIGILDGERRRKIKRGHEENERRKEDLFSDPEERFRENEEGKMEKTNSNSNDDFPSDPLKVWKGGDKNWKK